MTDKQKYVVLAVKDGEEGWMPTYSAQVAMVHDYDSMEKAATCNVGSHPDAQKRGKPYRVIVVPYEHWHEFQVYSDRELGRDVFNAVPNEHDLTIVPHQTSSEGCRN